MMFHVMSLFSTLYFLVFLMLQAFLTQSWRAISGPLNLLLHLKSQLAVSGLLEHQNNLTKTVCATIKLPQELLVLLLSTSSPPIAGVGNYLA